MEELDITHISVYAIPPLKKLESSIDHIVGGSLDITPEVKKIFLPSFNGKLSKSHRLQPFHFNFLDATRSNFVRDRLVRIYETSQLEGKNMIARELAFHLSQKIDKRTGELLFCFAYGHRNSHNRFAMWSFPHDDPIQMRTKDGKPKVSEIRNAFSKSSNLRKACYLEFSGMSIGRNDITKGSLVDSTAGRGKLVSDYWLTSFLDGTIEILKTRGTNQIVKYLKMAQKKASTPDEHDSVKGAFYSLVSGGIKNTTMKEFGNLLVGSPREIYMKSLPKAMEVDARFEIDQQEVKARIKKTHLVLKNSVEVLFPTEGELDPEDFIEEVDGVRYFKIREEINETYYQ